MAGSLRIGGGAHRLELVLTSGQALIDTMRLETTEGVVQDWPAGTAVYFTVKNKGTGLEQRWDLAVDGPYVRIDVPAEQVDLVSKAARARLWIDYGQTGTPAKPFVFAEGEVQWDG